MNVQKVNALALLKDILSRTETVLNKQESLLMQTIALNRALTTIFKRHGHHAILSIEKFGTTLHVLHDFEGRDVTTSINFVELHSFLEEI